MSAYQDYLATGRTECVPSLKDFYKDDFHIGAAVSPYWMFRPECDGALRKHFSSLTAENCMKPCELLDHAATLASGSETRAQFNFAAAAPLMEYAQRNGMAVRFHTLAWHNQTPRWFFTKGWSADKDAPLCDRETMLARLDGVDTSTGSTWDEVGRNWAMANGISDGTNGAGEITREQLATMLHRYMGELDHDHDITYFEDHHETSDWAREAKEWAVGTGVLNGKGNADGTLSLDPTGDASRAEVAQMFMNFLMNHDI